MTFVDVFMAAVPTASREAYVAHTEQMAPVFREHGALAVHEAWGVDVPDGTVTSMPLAVKKQDDETVVVGWVVWPDKATRDAGMPKVFADPRASHDAAPMPFDGKRLIYGGFETFMEA